MKKEDHNQLSLNLEARDELPYVNSLQKHQADTLYSNKSAQILKFPNQETNKKIAFREQIIADLIRTKIAYK